MLPEITKLRGTLAILSTQSALANKRKGQKEVALGQKYKHEVGNN